MARTSRRYDRYDARKEENTQKVFYKAGIYTRLSSDRKEEWREKSYSIETQIICAKEYALKENIQIVNVYTDYEYSGTNFERPQFQQMMEDIRARRINCIIIRDLSRLGREYLEMGRLIDKVFPFLGVRFISISDKVDTLKDEGSNKSFEIVLKNIVNDLYAKDISVKIKTSKHNRAKNGYFIGSVPPFGYKIMKLKEGQKLVIDEKVRFIVENIFKLTLEGYSQYEVAKYLNKEGYTNSMTYYKTGRIYRIDGDPQWTKGTVSKMLVNRSYTGTLVQGVKQQYLAKGLKQKRVEESEYIIFENAHEAIISKEDFEKVAKGRENRLLKHSFSSNKHEFERDYENRYKGLIYSYEGQKLYRRTRIYGKKQHRLHYSFQTDSWTGRLDNQKSMFIMEEELDKALMDKITEQLKKRTSENCLKSRISQRFDKSVNKYNEDIEKVQKMIEKELKNKQRSYEKYKLGKIDKCTFLANKEISLNHIDLLKNEVLIIENKIAILEKDRNKSLKWISDILDSQNVDKLSSDFIHNLVEKVVVYGNHKFEIIFKFEMDKLVGGASNE